MVSTRSQSVLSADGANGDTAATAGEVSSAAPTPRRSGRLSRGAATPTAAAAAAAPAAKAPPASARAARSRRPLKAIAEEQEQAADEQQAAQEQEEQQQPEQEGAGEHAAAPRARRRSGAAAAAAASAPAQQEVEEAEDAAGAAETADAAGEGGIGAAATAGQAEPLKADAAVVDLLAQQMFAALDGAFGAVAGGDGSSSESDSEPEPAAQAAAGQQQQQQAAVGAGHGTSDEGSDSEGEGQGHHVPAHLRWRPELTLPGMGPPQQRQRGGSTQVATAAAAAAAPSVHVVRRGSKDSLHVPPPDERARARAARKTAPDTAGKAWFDMPATKITDEVKSDLRMLRLRGALDPKAHYKKLDDTKFPKYFQMGTVVEGAADFYSGRLTNKQRKRTLTEEIMADEGLTQVRKKRYSKLQEERSYWAKKKPGRKTENERRKKAHHRPKH